MAYADRVQETTTTTGTGTITLAGAVSDYQSFQSAFATGSKIRYVIDGLTDWETGEGTLATTTTLSRDLVYESSNAGALVNLAAGTHNVRCDLPAKAVADMGMAIAFRENWVNT